MSNRWVWVVYGASVLTITIAFTLLLRAYHDSEEQLLSASTPQLYSYSSVDQVKATFERLASTVKDHGKPESNWEQNIELRYGLLRSKLNIILNDSPLNRTFKKDAEYLQLLTEVDLKLRSIDPLLKNLERVSTTKESVISIIEAMRPAIAALDNRAYKLQVNRYEDMLAALKNSQQTLFVYGMFVWALMVIWSAVFLEVSLRYRRIAKERLAAIKRKNVFLAAVKHELSTPLQSIIGAMSVLSEIARTDPDRELIGDIEASANQIVAQMKDLSEYSRLDVGGLSVRKTRFTMSDLVHDTIIAFKLDADQKGLALLWAGDPSDNIVIADYDRIRQILSNLISNAIKFTNSGEVKLTVQGQRKLPSRLVFDISDTGIGIAEHDIPKIFEPFEQLGDTGSDNGMGLGLAIVKQVVDLLGGTITVNSSPENGSTFVVSVPAEFVSE